MRKSKQAVVPGGVMLSMMRKVRVLPYGFFFCGNPLIFIRLRWRKIEGRTSHPQEKRDPSRFPRPFSGKENGVFREVFYDDE